jgi:hypothetical protein
LFLLHRRQRDTDDPSPSAFFSAWPSSRWPARFGGAQAFAQIAPKPPEAATLKANADMARTLPFANRQDFEDAMRGFIGTVPDALVPGPARARRGA